MSELGDIRVTVAMHVHTLYSPCAETEPEQIEMYCREKGVDVVGITDHNTIAGALVLQAMARGLRVIIGEEIETCQGEITGLFLKEEIEPGLDALVTCERIKEQGGLVYIPHPFDPFKIRRLRTRPLMRVLDMVDIIEVFNAKSIFPIFNPIATTFAQQHGIAAAAGSDAHYLDATDVCVNEVSDFATPQEFLANLRDGRLVTKRSGPLRAWWVGIKNVLRGQGHVVKRFGRD